VIEQFAVGRVLHDKEQVLWCFNQLVELNDVGVAHELQDMNLAAHTLYVRRIDYARLVEDLDSDGFVGGNVYGRLNLTEGAFA